MKKRYTQPDMETKRVLSMEMVADITSANDNDLDISDTGWENADL